MVVLAEAGFAAFGGSERARKELHVADCSDCQELLAEACRGLASSQAPEFRRASLLRPGSLLARRYRIERFLARGGMGEVYEVRDMELEGSVLALKTISASAADDAVAIRRLKSEVRLAQRVRHPNCCSVYHFGSHEDPNAGILHFLTMEFVSGETLLDRLRREGRIAPDLAYTIALQLLDALGAAHAVGVLHRDFKSSNVMLKERRSLADGPHAMIMDFGLARPLDENAERLTTDQRVLIGSAAYMSPEQVLGEPLTTASDIYAFGVVLFEMLTARLPFVGKGAVMTALMRLEQQPAKPSDVVAELGAGWDRVVLGCLARRVDQRFRTAEEARAVLLRLERSGGALLAPPSAPAHASAATRTELENDVAAAPTLETVSPPPPPPSVPEPLPPVPAAARAALESTPLAPVTPKGPPTPQRLFASVAASLQLVRTAQRPRWLLPGLGLAALVALGGGAVAWRQARSVEVTVQSVVPAPPPEGVAPAPAPEGTVQVPAPAPSASVLPSASAEPPPAEPAPAAKSSTELLLERAYTQELAYRRTRQAADCERARELYRQYLQQPDAALLQRGRAQAALRELATCTDAAPARIDTPQKPRLQIDPEDL
jgi:serine/threonine protein kinase